MLQEFKKFIMKGSVLDLAVAVVIGGAFGKVVSSFVDDIIMPPIGLILGKVDFKNLYINLSSGSFNSLTEAKAAGATTINYGMFLNQIVSLVIIGFAVFILVKFSNRFKPQEVTEPTTRSCPECLMEIPTAARKCGHCQSAVA